MVPYTTKMKWFIVCFWASAVYSVQSQPIEEFTELHYQQWNSFKNQFVKRYETEDEDTYRMKIFMQNSREIARHNELYKQGKVSFELGMNEYGDLSEEEFNRLMTSDFSSYLNKSMEELGVSEFTPDDVDIPSSLDWRMKSGVVTPVKNQRQCGSCWAFSSTGALEGQMFLRYGRRVLLSEQNLVDCSGRYGNHGCNGGFMTAAYEYIKRNGGIDSESAYPYEARDDYCRYRSQGRAAWVTGFRTPRSEDEESLKQAVATVGPIAVSIQSSTRQFRFYRRGVLYVPGCGRYLDHAVLVVGYGSEDGRDYWLVKNSWGTSWGDDGYVKMARNMENNCGIASTPVYPTV